MTIHSKTQAENSMLESGPKKGWITGTEILNLAEDDKSRFLWEPFIPKVGMVALAGASDCGKSTLVRQLAISIATKQKTFLGSPLNVNHGRACYIATEDEQYGTKPVLQKQLKGFGFDALDTLHFDFESENFYKDVETFLSEFRVDLIVIDAWLDIFQGNPNDAAAVRSELKPWFRLAKKHECCFLLLHHNVKNSENSDPNKNKLNGSQALEAKLRCIFELRMAANAPSDERHLTIIKGNYLPPEQKNKPWILKLDSESMLFTKIGESTRLDGVAKRKGYDRDLWLARYKEVAKDGLSIKSVVGILDEKFPDEEVPKMTWFKENKVAMDGRSNGIENDRPTALASLDSLVDPTIEENPLRC